MADPYKKSQSLSQMQTAARLIVGIADKKVGQTLDDRWEGISDIEKLNGHLQALFEVQPPLDLQCEFMKREGKDGYALRIIIEKGSQVCLTADHYSISYEMKATSNVALDLLDPNLRGN